MSKPWWWRRSAAGEFEKILRHRGLVAVGLLYPLAHLELARAHQLADDTARARKCYQDFPALWKDADPDLPLLQQAKGEYAQLKLKIENGKWKSGRGRLAWITVIESEK